MRESREHGQGATPRSARRRFGRRATPVTDTERIAAVAAEADVPVEQVLREVADFRLALETDMIIAAAAVDAENTDVLAGVLDDERLELATFHDRLLSRLADAAADDEIALRRARRAPRRGGAVARMAAAAAAAVAVFGAAQTIVSSPSTTAAANTVALENANRDYRTFNSAVNGGSAAAVHEAAEDLHASLEELINEHAGDPEAAERAAQLLQLEISLLQIKDPAGASHVLARAQRLARLLRRAAPPEVRQSVAPALDAAISASPSPRPSRSATPSPTPTSSPRASSSSTDKDDDDAPGLP